MNFFKVLVQLDRFFRERGMDYAVVGAFALRAFGIARATADLDLVVESSAQRPLLAFLEGLGYETLHVSPGYSNHVHPLGVLGRVDFLYLGGNTAREVFKGATPRLTLKGTCYPVPRPEHLAAMKVFAIHNAPERAPQDMADIAQLLRIPGVDRDEIRGYFARHGMRDEFDRILEDAETHGPRS